MQDTLCWARHSGQVHPASSESFSRRFGTDLVPWRAAFLAMHLEKTIMFDHEGVTYFVGPFDQNVVGQSAQAFGQFALPEELISLKTEDGPPVVKPTPKLTADGDLLVFEVGGDVEVPGYVRLVARDADHARELFRSHWGTHLRRDFLETVSDQAGSMLQLADLGLKEVSGWTIEHAENADVADYPRLF